MILYVELVRSGRLVFALGNLIIDSCVFDRCNVRLLATAIQHVMVALLCTRNVLLSIFYINSCDMISELDTITEI